MKNWPLFIAERFESGSYSYATARIPFKLPISIIPVNVYSRSPKQVRDNAYLVWLKNARSLLGEGQ